MNKFSAHSSVLHLHSCTYFMSAWCHSTVDAYGSCLVDCRFVCSLVCAAQRACIHMHFTHSFIYHYLEEDIQCTISVTQLEDTYEFPLCRKADHKYILTNVGCHFTTKTRQTLAATLHRSVPRSDMVPTTASTLGS